VTAFLVTEQICNGQDCIDATKSCYATRDTLIPETGHAWRAYVRPVAEPCHAWMVAVRQWSLPSGRTVRCLQSVPSGPHNTAAGQAGALVWCYGPVHTRTSFYNVVDRLRTLSRVFCYVSDNVGTYCITVFGTGFFCIFRSQTPCTDKNTTSAIIW